MSYSYTFKWPKGPEDVIVTGTFDNWSGALPLVKTSNGSFEITLPLSSAQLKDDQLEFKFIVDGDWTTSPDYNISEDQNGNRNNILFVSELSSQTSSNQTNAMIPEAAGLSVPLPEKDLTTTVLPSEEGIQKTLAGEPGVVVPSNPHEIDAFNEISTVDAKELNEKLNNTTKEETEFKSTVMPSTEGQQQTLGEPGVVVPTDPQSIEAFSEYSTVDPKVLNAKMNDVTTDKKVEETEDKQIKVKEIVQKNKLTGEEVVIHREEVPTNTSTTTTTTTTPNSAPVTKDAPSSSTETSQKPKKEKKSLFKKIKSILK